MIKRTVKEIAEFFGVDVGVERGGIYLFAPLFNFGELSHTLISDFSNYKEGDVVKPTSDTDNYIEKESKYHYAREVIFTLRACHAISVEVYLHWMDKINDEEIKEKGICHLKT
ncbi:MAG TPA: hypothetical protein PKK80_02935 [Bacilli bacterium]|nr:hypothetical protein [Bacilli bacterium]